MNRQRYNHLSATVLAAVLLALPSSSSPAGAQAIVETGAVYAMPRTVPNSGSLIATLGKTYNPLVDPHLTRSTSRGDSAPDFDDDDPQATYKAAGQRSITLWNEARACEKQGKSSEAEKLYRDALTIRWRIWRDRDPAVTQLLTVIGSLEEKQGRLDYAENCYHDLLTLTAKRYGPGSWELCTPLNKLAHVQTVRKNYQDAASNYKLVAQLTERKFGDADPRTADARAHLAQSLNSAEKSTAKPLQGDRQ